MDTFTILTIGDSHTAGFPDYDPMMGGDPESSYQYWLKKGLTKNIPEKDYALINQGLCGDTSRGIVSRLLHTLSTTRPHLVILAGGTNDLGMQGEKTIFENMKEGYDACRTREIPLITPSIPPVSLNEYVSRVAAVNLSIQAYAARFPRVLFADWFKALKDGRGFLENRYNAGDGVHLSVEGYMRIGTLLVPLVIEALSFKML